MLKAEVYVSGVLVTRGPNKDIFSVPIILNGKHTSAATKNRELAENMLYGESYIMEYNELPSKNPKFPEPSIWIETIAPCTGTDGTPPKAEQPQNVKDVAFVDKQDPRGASIETQTAIKEIGLLRCCDKAKDWQIEAHDAWIKKTLGISILVEEAVKRGAVKK